MGHEGAAMEYGLALAAGTDAPCYGFLMLLPKRLQLGFIVVLRPGARVLDKQIRRVAAVTRDRQSDAASDTKGFPLVGIRLAVSRAQVCGALVGTAHMRARGTQFIAVAE
jgi:hypothetical protein